MINNKLKFFNHQTSGMLITFCGLDGCGKTTVIRMLNDWYTSNNIIPYLTWQPTNNVRQAPIFRAYMDSPNHNAFDYRSLSLLAASDRVQHSNITVLPQLEQGKVVISDRYFYSCIANLHARGYTNDRWIIDVSRYIPRPDLSFFLDVPVELAVQRVRDRPDEKNRYIDMDLQYRLRHEYIKLCKQNKGILIDSTKDSEQTFTQIIKKIMNYRETLYEKFCH